jgi:hypothetical protein
MTTEILMFESRGDWLPCSDDVEGTAVVSPDVVLSCILKWYSAGLSDFSVQIR